MKFIKSRKKTPFWWGVHDCVLFAVGCANAMIGGDLAEKYRYSSEEEAAAIIKGAGGFRELVSFNMGPEIPPKMAQRGDWVMILQDDHEALAVCIGIMAIAAGKDGLVTRPMSEAITAWRVG